MATTRAKKIPAAPKAVEYDTFDGRRVRAEFRTHPISHFYLADCETGKLLASPIKSKQDWEAFVWNLENDSTTNFVAK